MSITSAADLRSSLRQLVAFRKGAVAGSANTWKTAFTTGGVPPAGSASPSNTANGIVPTDATAGYPNIQFGSGNGYLTFCELSSNVVGRIFVFDRLFHAGAYAFNDSVTLASQPSYSVRVPNTDYSGLQLWYEQVTNATGAQNVAVTYTDQAGNTGHTTGTVAMPSTLTVGSCLQFPLAAGDCGLQKIESVVGSVASAGTFNLFVARPLLLLGAQQTSTLYSRNLEQNGLPQVYADSALSYLVYNANATEVLDFEIASK